MERLSSVDPPFFPDISFAGWTWTAPAGCGYDGCYAGWGTPQGQGSCRWWWCVCRKSESVGWQEEESRTVWVRTHLFRSCQLLIWFIFCRYDAYIAVQQWWDQGGKDIIRTEEKSKLWWIVGPESFCSCLLFLLWPSWYLNKGTLTPFCFVVVSFCILYYMWRKNKKIPIIIIPPPWRYSI